MVRCRPKVFEGEDHRGGDSCNGHSGAIRALRAMYSSGSLFGRSVPFGHSVTFGPRALRVVLRGLRVRAPRAIQVQCMISGGPVRPA
jgi:hypothetical protein